AELQSLVGEHCMSGDENVLVFDWYAFGDKKNSEFLSSVFNDSKIPGHYAALLDRGPIDPTTKRRGAIFWKSVDCIPFALAATYGTGFAKGGTSYPQFGRLLLIDTKGRVFQIQVDGTARNRDEPELYAESLQALGLEKRDKAYLARQKAARTQL